LLTLLWLIAAVALGASVIAWAKVRRLTKRLERLAESYWELRYEHGQLRARVNRLDAEPPAPVGEAAPPSGATAFVPLSSLKR
jgi:hypothetical protein